VLDHLVGWIVGGGAITAAVLVSLAFVTSDLRVKRSLRKLATSRVADVRDGQRVKLVGTIREGSTLVSPNRSAACVYYHAWHEELKRGTKGGLGWVAVGEEQHGCDFTLTDDTGEARIVAEGIEGALAASSYLEIEGGSPGTRGREAIVASGERDAVIGTVVLEASAGEANAMYRDGAARVVIRADGRPLIVSNDPAIIGVAAKTGP
jgi:hypothetical protein